MRLQSLRHDDAVDGAVGGEQDLALGQIEIERLALVARARHGFVGGVKRRQDRPDQAFGDLVGASADGELRLFVGKLGGRAHHDAVEGVRLLAPVRPITMRTASAARFSCGRSEHRSLEMRSGSIGTTRSGK